MKENPFKFGTVVDGPYFIDRKDEISKISSFIKGVNHLILISPRRFGKTSLIRKVMNESGRTFLYIDLQLIISVDDFASQLLKRIYRLFPMERLKTYLKSFRIIPSVILNPVTGETEISFRPGSMNTEPLEDVLNLVEKLSSPRKKIILILDEFQEIFRIHKELDRFLRSIMQIHKNINYIFSGSSESMIREIFERKSSPFYHFGYLMLLGRIPDQEFARFLNDNFSILSDNHEKISGEILKITDSHPYFTQQLAFTAWDDLERKGYAEDIVESSANEIVQSHDNDFERLWNNLNRTDMIILAGMAQSISSPLSVEFSNQFGTGAASTVFSTLQRLTSKGILIKEGSKYSIDDPFFKRWILLRRQL